MIQRIQSVYLFLVAACAVALCWVAPVQFLAPDGVEMLPMFTYHKWPLLVLTAVVALLAMVTIFLFKNRILQARLCVVNVVLNLGYYALLALYIAYAVNGHESIANQGMIENLQFYLMPWAAIPLVNLILTLMSLRRILKDEALVRAADRIR